MVSIPTTDLAVNTLQLQHPTIVTFITPISEYEDMSTFDLLHATDDQNPLLQTFEKVRQGVYNSGYVYGEDGIGHKPTEKQKAFLAPLGPEEFYGFFPQPDARRAVGEAFLTRYGNDLEGDLLGHEQHWSIRQPHSKQENTAFDPLPSMHLQQSPSEWVRQSPGPEEVQFEVKTRRYSALIADGHLQSPMYHSTTNQWGDSGSPTKNPRSAETPSLLQRREERVENWFNDPKQAYYEPQLPALQGSLLLESGYASHLPPVIEMPPDPFIDHPPQDQPPWHPGASCVPPRKARFELSERSTATKRRKYEKLVEDWNSPSPPNDDSEDEDYAPTPKKGKKQRAKTATRSSRRKLGKKPE